ncbi:pseudouridine synthase [Photobacterium angustum]|uniref:Pseudouridine synthase n=1 Tax=Photobacterium angustum TaxID=661 RepID=A0ABX5GYA5_PHOAN|nr:23S rRNA pseudouridine(2604) synthase RluF [Photobacterium angustum]KJG39117.1 pseudouridine synthase [Photobacterium angustum]PSX01035.1 23S rRNA pseudouridine(2604) synthase RluF [Photobacterium angustum]
MSQNPTEQQSPKGVRLNKFISDTGYCSRREADKLIDQGRVTINGQKPEMGVRVMDNDDVLIDDKPLRSKERPIYIALNKPTGITCTTERHIEGNIVDFIGHRKRIFPIGRLDKPSDGLIFLTNDGDIVNKILRAGNSHEKEYVVRVDKVITPEFLEKMASGVEILDTVTLPCKVTKETNFSFRIVLTQGLNRQIRRMCEALGYEVYKLRRVRIMNITIDGLPNGKWRYLTDDEIGEINRLIAQSSGTEEASKVDAEGRKIVKATDAKLYDHRQQDARNEKRAQEKAFKTYSGTGEFTRRPGGQRQNRRNEEGSESRQQRGQGRNDRNSNGRNSNDRNGQGRNDNRRPARTSERDSKPSFGGKSTGIKKWKSKRED